MQICDIHVSIFIQCKICHLCRLRAIFNGLHVIAGGFSHFLGHFQISQAVTSNIKLETLN